MTEEGNEIAEMAKIVSDGLTNGNNIAAKTAAAMVDATIRYVRERPSEVLTRDEAVSMLLELRKSIKRLEIGSCGVTIS